MEVNQILIGSLIKKNEKKKTLFECQKNKSSSYRAKIE